MGEELFWATAPSILVGIVMFYWNRQQSKRQKRDDDRDRIRAKSEIVQLEVLMATADLGYASAIAVRNGEPHETLDPLIAKYESALEDFKQFEREQVVASTQQK